MKISLSLYGILTFAVHAFCSIEVTAVTMPSQNNPCRNQAIASSLQRSFIWLDSVPTAGQAYVVFRKKIELTGKPLRATLSIFADTRYLLWINGQYINSGPCRFDPKRPEYDELDVSRYLKPRENCIAVVVHYFAIASFSEWNLQCSRMMDHHPGLTARLDISTSDGGRTTIKTDSTWRACARTRFQPSPGGYTSVCDKIDARLDPGDWTAAEYDDANWEPVTGLDAGLWGTLFCRSIPLLRETEIVPRSIVQETIENKTIDTEQDLDKRLALDMRAGHQLVIDVGRMVQAYSVLEFEAVAGSKLEVDYATQFFDTGRQPKKQTFGSGPNLYISRAGRQIYISSDTFGFKYLIIKVISGRVKLLHVKVVDRRYPYDRLGRFHCSDSTLNKLWEICVNTVSVCSEDAYVDCADRERAQWMADGYMMSYPVARVALAGPAENDGYRYSDPRLLQNMLRHVALGQLADGRLQPMRPSNYPAGGRHGVIDDYSCLWVQAVRENYDRTADKAFSRELWPAVVRACEYFINRRTSRGLVHAGEFIYFNNSLAYVTCEGASINSYIYGALRDAAHVGRMIGETKSAKRFDAVAEELVRSCNLELWDAETGAYHGAIIMDDSSVARDAPPSFSEKYKGLFLGGRRTPVTGHAALMACYYNLVPLQRQEQVFDFMLNHLDEEKPFPYTYRYFLEVLYRKNHPQMDQLALDIMRKQFVPMTAYETGTTSENWNSGSFVHESGAHPAYFLSAYVLGVRTLSTDKGLELFIEPRLGELTEASGVVLSEYGPVAVSYQRDMDQSLAFTLQLPKLAHSIVSLPMPEDSIAPTIVLDGKTIVKKGKIVGSGKIRGRFFTFSLGPGAHSGFIKK